MISKDSKSKLLAPANPLKKTQEKAASSAVSFVGIYPAPPPKPRNKNKARVIVTVIAAFVASILLVAVSIILFVPPERDQQAHNRIKSVTKPVDSKLLREKRSNEDISASNARENIASLMDDGTRDKDYKDHIFIGKEDTRARSRYRRASTMRAKWMKARKTMSSFSNLEKIVRKLLSLRNRRSISLRFL